MRLIAGTLDATAGTVTTSGRIAAILELGTGFHPDYSGRENIYLGGLCLGLQVKEIDARVAEVIEFSELEEFIDQPFRTYSSGMQARLAFSVATCVDPDILIIDEALSVGDARFQLKSFDRMREFKRRGKSIIVVSHSINQLVSICDRAILLERGRVLMDGNPNTVGNAYHELLFPPGGPLGGPLGDHQTGPRPRRRKRRERHWQLGSEWSPRSCGRTAAPLQSDGTAAPDLSTADGDGDGQDYRLPSSRCREPRSEPVMQSGDLHRSDDDPRDTSDRRTMRWHSAAQRTRPGCFRH